MTDLHTLPSSPAAVQPAPGSTLDVRSSAFDVQTPNSPASVDPQPPAPPEPRAGESTFDPQQIFSPFPGETPRAFSAFITFFDLGRDRSLPALADHLGEKLDSLKKWSSRFRWSARIQQFNSGLLQQHAETEAADRAHEAADWARRASLNREQQWDAAQKLSGAVRCFLDSFGDRELEKMTLGQVSRALQISSQLARQALSGETTSETAPLAPIQVEITAALKRAYAEPPASLSDSPPSPLRPGRGQGEVPIPSTTASPANLN